MTAKQELPPAMVCQECQAPKILTGSGGLLCPNGHGRVISPAFSALPRAEPVIGAGFRIPGELDVLFERHEVLEFPFAVAPPAVAAAYCGDGYRFTPKARRARET